VTNGSSIEEFAVGATRDVAPLKVISGPTLTNLADVAIDSAGNIYTSSNSETIQVYAPGRTGVALPVRTIEGDTPEHSTFGAFGIDTDTSGNLYVSKIDGAVMVFAPGASGTDAPTRSILGSNTGMGDWHYLAAADDGTIYVGDYGNSAVPTFSPFADGDVAPATRIVGLASQVNGPFPVAVQANGTVYVGNCSQNSISIFDNTSSVTSASPATGPLAGGTLVTITGSEFAVGSTVTFGGVLATDVIVVNATTITAAVRRMRRGRRR
jgi:hypothetical protein